MWQSYTEMFVRHELMTNLLILKMSSLARQGYTLRSQPACSYLAFRNNDPLPCNGLWYFKRRDLSRTIACLLVIFGKLSGVISTLRNIFEGVLIAFLIFQQAHNNNNSRKSVAFKGAIPQGGGFSCERNSAIFHICLSLGCVSIPHCMLLDSEVCAVFP